jgi:hypothetical protein
VRYSNYICHKSIKSDSWESGKISEIAARKAELNVTASMQNIGLLGFIKILITQMNEKLGEVILGALGG